MFLSKNTLHNLKTIFCLCAMFLSVASINFSVGTAILCVPKEKNCRHTENRKHPKNQSVIFDCLHFSINLYTLPL